MYLEMYMYMYMYTCTCTHVHVYLYIYTCTCTCSFIHVHVYGCKLFIINKSICKLAISHSAHLGTYLVFFDIRSFIF